MRGQMSWIKYVVFAIIAFAMICIAVDMTDTISHNCKPNGEQRLANGVDGVVVENKLICDGRRVKWSRY